MVSDPANTLIAIIIPHANFSTTWDDDYFIQSLKRSLSFTLFPINVLPDSSSNNRTVIFLIEKSALSISLGIIVPIFLSFKI